MKKLELIESLLEEAKTLEFGQKTKLDAIKRRAEMIIRNAFGEESKYLRDLSSVHFYPAAIQVSEQFERSRWQTGKEEILNLFNIMKEEVILFDKSSDSSEKKSDIGSQGNSIFIVHGHDETMKQTVARILEKLDLNPIILHEKPNAGRTIIEKFTDFSDVSFAVVLLSPDDVAHERTASPEQAKFRARQNVILELGYFLGKLGRSRVVVLFNQEENFELPSDYSGVLFVPYEVSGRWQYDLIRELKASGYIIDANKLLE